MYRIALASCLLLASPALAAETIPGPVEARVLRVIDGDSFVAEAHVWPGHNVTVNVRIRGIDAPEIKSRCASEREAAETARATLEALIAGGTVAMTRIGGGKYYGRVLADVTAHDGRRVAEAMIAQSHARPYAGGKRIAFCR
jgi:endonuclease YncB( thermonuclease family)